MSMQAIAVPSMPAPSEFIEREIPSWRRAVLKVGSSLLAGDSGLSPRYAEAIAAFVCDCHNAGREIVIVSSGAVAAGRAIARQQPKAGAAMAERQALAALGQARLIGFWQTFFDRPVAQVLLTHDDVRNRRRYLNARATLQELLRHGALPIVNENDTVSVDELKLGDNDTLGAIVATLIDADVLLIATDIDGLYDTNPRTHADARPVESVPVLTDAVMAMAGGAGSRVGTGGMRTKLLAAQRAGATGIDTLLFNGTRESVVRRLAVDRLVGTRFIAARSRIAARKHWLRHAPAEPGGIFIDAGAAAAMSVKGASLLPSGVIDVEGEFRRGDMIEVRLRVNDKQQDSGATASHLFTSQLTASQLTASQLTASRLIARGITQYSAADIRRIARRKSHEIDTILGYNYGDTILHRDDLSLIDGGIASTESELNGAGSNDEG